MLTTTTEAVHEGEHSDTQLLRLARSGDIEAFRVVYKRHGAAALLLACRIVGDPELAADVTHEAFHSLWRSTASYDPGKETVSVWVLRVTRRKAEEALSRQPAGAERAQPAEDPGAG